MTIKEIINLPYIKVSGLEQVCNIPAGTIRPKSDKPIADKYIKAIEAELSKLSNSTIASSEPIIKEVIREVIVEKIVYRDKDSSLPAKEIVLNTVPLKKEDNYTINIDGKEYTKIRISHHAGAYPKGTIVYLCSPNKPENRKTKSDGIYLYEGDNKIDYENYMTGFVLSELYNKITAIKK